MASFLPHLRRPLHVASALLVVATMAHCAAEWPAELGPRLVAHGDGQLPLPIEQPAGHNESSCLCGGATLATPVSAGVPTSSDGLLAIAGMADAGVGFLHPPLSEPVAEYSAAPLPAGRQLRALYGSLLI